jgi:hypothetical protein
MSKRFILSLVIAGVAAIPLATMSDQRPFDELVERADITEQASSPDSKCPLSRERIDKTELSLLSICREHGLAAYEAAQRYPSAASRIFGVYGEDQTFRKILDQYGHPIIPVIAYFVESGSLVYQIRQALGDALGQMWDGQKPKWELSSITREQIGLIAINQIAARGQEMLAEFEIVDGVAKRKPIASIMLQAKDFFFGGVENIETVLVRGERLPNWGEVGLAAIDVTVVAGGVGAVAKAARLGTAARAEGGSARLMAESAYKAVRTVGKTSVKIAPFAFVYAAVTRPGLMASAAGWLAEQFGYNRLVGIFVFYWVAIYLALGLLRPLIWCGLLIVRLFRLFRRLLTPKYNAAVGALA